MSAPTITSIEFDRAMYAPGDTITATIKYLGGSSSHSFTGNAVDSITQQTGDLTVTFVVTDPTTVVVTDSDNRTWTQTSDDGSVAVFTATA